MIIKGHIRGGYRATADYLKDIGKNEKARVLQVGDPSANNLDEAFQNMWAVACNSKVKKALHHISINPFWDERLTDEQVFKIVERLEQKYGYQPNNHQRVIVEHIKDGRQHFHVMWNRVSMATGKAVWPGHHWNKSRQAAREMEKELGLKVPVSRRTKRYLSTIRNGGKLARHFGRSWKTRAYYSGHRYKRSKKITGNKSRNGGVECGQLSLFANSKPFVTEILHMKLGQEIWIAGRHDPTSNIGAKLRSASFWHSPKYSYSGSLPPLPFLLPTLYAMAWLILPIVRYNRKSQTIPRHSVPSQRAAWPKPSASTSKPPSQVRFLGRSILGSGERASLHHDSENSSY